MRAHTRKHHTTNAPYYDYEKDDIPMTVEEFRKLAFDDFPRWAIYLHGYRMREGLTQKELGKYLGIAQANISRMERGKKPIGKKLAKRLADFFKTDYKMFL
jgi:DNA-binding XRE family transcriptional regulator